MQYLSLFFLLLSISCDETFEYKLPKNTGNDMSPPKDSSVNCPANYIPVPANPLLGTNADFCVAQYEMRNDGLDNPVSKASDSPWGNLTVGESAASCASLGAKFSLISNEEWMTIARNIESNPINWSEGSVGQGFLNRGHSNDSFTGPCDSLIPILGADCSTSGSGHEQKRTHTLTNGSVIWDLAGNVSEWVNWTVLASEKAYASSDSGTVYAWRELTLINSNILNTSKMRPESWRSENPALSSAQNIGRYYSGAGAFEAAGVRGGRWENHISAGIYSLDLDYDLTDYYLGIGFRCVFRP